ncbi:hypothetical protein U9M48_040729 [Paspalum notatum var. saurae]|uniref:Uncharacterized protein n=1 Tax=Paspalum notatum var. saurae TaxID=547442 RepID=A0AAQ3USZ0_PASNO
MAATPHVVVVPYPGSGSINPALQLSRLLHGHGVFITFVVTEHNLRRAQAAAAAADKGAAVSGREGFRIETIPDGLVDADRDKQDYDLGLSKATAHRCGGPLRELVLRLRGGAPPVTCLLPTVLMSFALEVARELGVPSMVLWTSSAAALMTCHSKFQSFLCVFNEIGSKPFNTGIDLVASMHRDESCLTNGYLDTTMIDWIPGMPAISLGDVSSFVRTTDPDDFGLWFNDTQSNNCTKAGALIINTFDALEPDVLTALRTEYPRIYTVGPLGSLLHRRHQHHDWTTDLI